MNKEDLMDELRRKTREVEVIGMKIDEFITLIQDTEQQISRLGRVDNLLFDEIDSKQFSDDQLKK